ncbi:MAG TPA: hypothetical protein VM536_19915, partial [Chloroflexia bacterium]|nr:hypothetical protein [Chloroflexia bacterium]
MLSLIAASAAFGLLTGLVAWQANATTYAAYHRLVDEGSVSVDAALRARSAALDHMGDAATYLATTPALRPQARARATARWADFNNEARVSWRNVTDPTQGEANVFGAADKAASDYIQQIGAMFAYSEANQPDLAATAFLAARETMNSRLVPALGGLESVKVEAMSETYAGASRQINDWRTALLIVAVLVASVLLAALAAVRRMHYAWSWPIGGALLLVIGL